MFRAAAKGLTRRTEDEPATARRRRRGETGRAFARTARAILRPMLRLPRQAFAAAVFLSDTLDWLTLWESQVNDSSPCDNLDAPRNDLSLRL